MQSRFKIFIFILLVFSIQAMASTNLCSITSDIDSSMAKLTYDLDTDGRTITHLYQETYENNKMQSKDEIDTEKLTHGGIVLLQKDKLVVVRIWSDNFDKDQGGVMYLDTLYNGISGERRQYELDVTKNETGIVLSNNKLDFTKMKFIAKRSKILGVIGIEKIIFSK